MGNSKPAVEPTPRKKKKKGRPSLLDLQKRSLRLEKLQEEGQEKKKAHDPNPSPPNNPYSRLPPSSSSTRRSTRRHPDPSDDDDDDDCRREKKKLRLVPRLPHRDADDCASDSGESSGGRERKADAAGDRGKTGRPNSASKATDGLREPLDSGPTTPLPDKKLLVFILDRLQKKDTYGVFSEPVDPEELPDYHDIIKHPMDFGTMRKKLDDEVYANLEQFENDVFLISSNAMCYNAPDTIFYRQGRAIQELAKKDFENLRRESDSSEPEAKPRRGRPPLKNIFKQKGSKPLAGCASLDCSEVALANTGNNGPVSNSGHDLLRNGLVQQGTLDVPGVSYGLRSKENCWTPMHKSESNERCTGSGLKGVSAKFGKKLTSMDESRRSTYNHSCASSSIQELPVIAAFHGERKLLVPVGLHMEHSYSHSLARFSANLGPVFWGIAAKRIERVLPRGMKFGHGWVGDSEALPQLPPLLATAPPRSTALTTVSPSNSVAGEEGRVGSDFPFQALPIDKLDSSSDASAVLGIGSKQQLDRGNNDQGNQPKVHSQLSAVIETQAALNGFNAALVATMPFQARKVGSSLPPGSFILESAVTNAEMASRNNHGQIYCVADSQTAGDLRALPLSGSPLPGGSNDQQRQLPRFAPHPKSGPVPTDLNVRFQSQAPPSPLPALGVLVDPQQPDLALQL